MPDPAVSLKMLASIESLVKRTRARRQRDRVIVGAAWTLAVAVGALLALASLDMLSPLEVPMRIAAAAALVVLIIAAAGVCVAVPIARPESVARVANLIERTIKGMHNRLITALDLRRPGGAGDSDAKLADPFVQRLLEQTHQRLDGFTPAMVADPAPMRRSLAAATAALVIAAALFATSKDRFTTAIQRLIHPTAAIAPVSAVAYVVVPGNASVLEGDPLTLAAQFTRGNDAHMTVRIKPASGVWTAYPLEPNSDGCPSFELSAVNEATQYQVVGGGTWSPVYQVDVVRRPRVESLAASVLLPKYMQIPEPRVIDGDLSVISAPVGSTIELGVSVAGHAAHGVVRTFKSNAIVVKENSEQELVWFDDALPSDSETTGTWRWVSDTTHSGAKAFTFDWARRPFGFKTRLAALPIGAGASLFVYTFIEASDAPGRITITASIGTRSYALRFSDPKASPAPALPAGTVAIEAGPLPPAGRWARLAVPIEKIIGAAPAAPVEVDGLTFEANTGRATFDRVGSLQTFTREVTNTTLEPLATFDLLPESAMTQPAASTRPALSGASPGSTAWFASLPVEKDYLFTVELSTEKGYKSPAILPMSVAATLDTAPKLVLEKPTQNVTLAQPQAVPVMLRVFDDYGIADVGLQTGKSPTELEPIHWFKTYTDNVTSDLVLTSLDPTALKLTPGAATTFQLVVRDRKGQIATSLPLRLALAAPNELTAANVDKGSAPLNPLFDALKKLVGVQGQLAGVAAGLVDAFDVKKTTTQPGATPIFSTTQPLPSGDALLDSKAKKDWERKQAEAVAKAVALSEAEREAMLKQLDAAVTAAQKSDSALPGEAQALSMMSMQLQQAGLEQQAMANAATAAAKRAEKQETPNPELDKAVADRLAKLAELTDEQKKEMEQLEKQLKQLEAARKDMATDPQSAQDRMQALLTEQRAQQATDQMDALDDTLESKRERLENLRAQIAALKEQTALATPAQLAAMAEQAAEAEKQAQEEMAEMKDLLRDEMAGNNAEDHPDDMLAPWQPPGQEFESTPVERDTPEKKDPKDPNKKMTDEEKKALAEKMKQDEEKAWDEPPPVPEIGSNVKEDERYKNKDTREDVMDESEDPNAPDAKDTRRQRLEKSEGKFTQALTAAAKRAQASRDRLNQMQSEVNDAMQQMSKQGESSPEQAAKTAQQLQKMMNSDAMRSAQSAARRAQQQAMMRQAARQAAQAAAKSGHAGEKNAQAQSSASGKAQANPEDQLDELIIPPVGLSGPSEGVGGTDRGVIMSVDLSGIDISKQAAGFYRLPPHIRDPLIQGLKEAAPEGYQTLIDAYYRQLGAEGK